MEPGRLRANVHEPSTSREKGHRDIVAVDGIELLQRSDADHGARATRQRSVQREGLPRWYGVHAANLSSAHIYCNCIALEH